MWEFDKCGVLQLRVAERPRLLVFPPPTVGSSQRDSPGRRWGRGDICLSVKGCVIPFGVFLRVVDLPHFSSGASSPTGGTTATGIGSTVGFMAHFNDGVAVVHRIGSFPEIELAGGVVVSSKSTSGILRVYPSLSAVSLLLFLIAGSSGQSLFL